MTMNLTTVNVTVLRVIPEETRLPFFWIYLIVATFALTVNSFSIKSALQRRVNNLQKVCLVNLTLADIFSSTMFAIINLETLCKDLKTWSLGEFMCYFTPVAQALGTTTSAFTLLLIALDRYRSVSAVMERKLNLELWKCISLNVGIWILCTAISLPLSSFYNYAPIKVIFPSKSEPIFQYSAMCVAIRRSRLTSYYVVITWMVFLPILIFFAWFYCNVALKIWHYRKPTSTVEGTNERSSYSTNTGSTRIPKTREDVRVEKKVKTMKIVIGLMVCFILCRLPYYLFTTFLLIKVSGSKSAWNAYFALNCLLLLNCALNPLMYIYLHQTLRFLVFIKDLIKRCIMWCCFTTDLEEFQKDNPFPFENYEWKKY
ncbi:unnamed protein product [Acanthoscelides obtectus]|uniref:G-protein coupled receptors family 1 profile domain-containing protein n=1 Tax=Acanthoscelides obtectus TaxID=200917 RepID=A0A9P0K0F1_ACAOB|nr:unnamed protein product [Acanthoscelides obtectus]CAK1647246.1 Substance-K receptor [Acanthoscelides obtectus]